MGPAYATDVCDGMFKSKKITVHGNATIVKQTGPKLMYSVEQRKALELMVIVEEKVPDCRWRWTRYSEMIGYKRLKSEKAYRSSLN